MIDINQIVKEVSARTNIDKEIVEQICKHPFLEVLRIMKDEQDTSDILFNGLFKFKLKRRYKENKTAKYSSK